MSANLSRAMSFDEFIGNKNLTRTLEIQISAAKKRGTPMPHSLFTGDPGCGKTTLSNICAKVMGSNFYSLNGATLSKKKQLFTVLLKLKKNDVVLIDEIHRIEIALQELLYTVMEDFTLSIPLKKEKKDEDGEILTYNIQPFTLIGATTTAGLLSKPFQDRFKSHNYLESYTQEDIEKIVELNARKLNISLDKEAIVEVSRRSKFTPRIAIARLEWISDFKLHMNYSIMDQVKVREAMAIKGIDDLGLERDDRAYLSKLIPGKPVGLQALVSMTGLSEETIKNSIEPYLLQKDIISIESRGRVLQEHASMYSRRKDTEILPSSINLDLDL